MHEARLVTFGERRDFHGTGFRPPVTPGTGRDILPPSSFFAGELDPTTLGKEGDSHETRFILTWDVGLSGVSRHVRRFSAVGFYSTSLRTGRKYHCTRLFSREIRGGVGCPARPLRRILHRYSTLPVGMHLPTAESRLFMSGTTRDACSAVCFPGMAVPSRPDRRFCRHGHPVLSSCDNFYLEISHPSIFEYQRPPIILSNLGSFKRE